MPIISEEINLSTPLDEYAAELFISRKPTESLEDFNVRVILAQQNLYNSGPEAFYKSLDYITDERTEEICTLNINITEQDLLNNIEVTDCNIEVNEEGLYVAKGQETDFYDFKDYVYLFNLIEELKADSNLILTLEAGYENLKFEKTANILKTSSKKKYLHFESNEALIVLPVNNVYRVLNKLNMLEVAFDPSSNEIINDNNENLTLIIEYVDLPLTLEWSRFCIRECNSAIFKSMLKDEDGFLTSEGAKLINQILEKQNTYWG